MTPFRLAALCINATAWYCDQLAYHPGAIKHQENGQWPPKTRL